MGKSAVHPGMMMGHGGHGFVPNYMVGSHSVNAASTGTLIYLNYDDLLAGWLL